MDDIAFGLVMFAAAMQLFLVVAVIVLARKASNAETELREFKAEAEEKLESLRQNTHIFVFPKTREGYWGKSVPVADIVRKLLDHTGLELRLAPERPAQVVILGG